MILPLRVPVKSVLIPRFSIDLQYGLSFTFLTTTVSPHNISYTRDIKFNGVTGSYSD